MINITNADNSNPTDDGEISQIELVGTITGKHVLAILRIKNDSEEIYQINQFVLGYKITAIANDSVTLTQSNKSTHLSLVPATNRKYHGNISNLNNAEKITRYEYRINRKTFNSLHNDTQTWLNNIGMKVLTEDGYFSGYQITRIKENSPAELLGLSEGDIITGINNSLIREDPNNFITKIGQLKNAKHFTLNMRNKQFIFELKFIINDDK
ncbi:MAG: hypothetical protein ACC653_01820 [Gammaproteobacteria bacterium]